MNTTQLAGAQTTSLGRVRRNNEDQVWIAPSHLDVQTVQVKGYLGIVADGMGGPAKGEVASEIAVRQVAKEYYDQRYADPVRALRNAVQVANSAVFEAAQQPGYAGMGTTLVAAAVIGNRVIFANVGDSRGYLVSQGQIEQVTRDHSLVQERVDQGILTAAQARQHQDKNLITRALGAHPQVQVDIFERTAQPGDMVVLCSDGVSNLVEDDEIARIVSQNPPQVAAQQLVDLADARGGYDNSTVAILPVGTAGQIARAKPLLWLVPIGMMLTLILISALALLAVRNGASATPTAQNAQTAMALAAIPTLTATPSRAPTITTPLPMPTSGGNVPPPVITPTGTISTTTPTPLPNFIPTDPPTSAVGTPMPTPTQTSFIVVTPTPTPTPTLEPPPRGEVGYNFDGTGIGVSRLTELFKLVEGKDPDYVSKYTDFYNAHPEIHCSPNKYDPSCVKGILKVKYDELAVMGLGDPGLRTLGPKWLVLKVDANNTANGLAGLKDYMNRWVLVRVRWENEQFRIDPTDFIFVYDPGKGVYEQAAKK